MIKTNNPIIWADYPDPDVIRVDDTYYMISTSMHMFPGAQILRSFDLLHWEHVCYVYNALGDTPSQRLDAGHIYGKGMWASTLRYHAGQYHVIFACNDTKKSHHFTAESAYGPWTRHEMKGMYYDCSLLFDDDGHVYIAHGHKEIRITEMEEDLSGPKAGGIDRIALVDTGNVRLGFEGTHFYKIDGRYCLFCIHWPNDGHARRTEVCYVAESLTGEFTGGTVVDDDLDFHNMGVAQGGVVDTPDGQWYMMLFQDHGAVGRIPVLVPMSFKNGFPLVKKIPDFVRTKSTHPEHAYMPLYTSDTLRTAPLNPLWQWNHEPHMELISISQRGLRITTDRVVKGLEQAVNTLTQRTFGPCCEAIISIDAESMHVGDYAGICALQGCYCQLAITRSEEGTFLSLISRQATYAPYAIAPSTEPILERAAIKLHQTQITLKVRFDFTNLADTAVFSYLCDGQWLTVGTPHHLVYRLDHFMGCRIGLFCYATETVGGSAVFSDFQYVLS